MLLLAPMHRPFDRAIVALRSHAAGLPLGKWGRPNRVCPRAGNGGQRAGAKVSFRTGSQRSAGRSAPKMWPMISNRTSGIGAAGSISPSFSAGARD